MNTEEMPYCYSDRPRVEEVFPGIFRIDLPAPQHVGTTNTYLITSNAHSTTTNNACLGRHTTARLVNEDRQNRCLLIDAGFNHPSTKKALDNALKQLEISWNNVDVFITHQHFDHWAGLSQIWQPEMRVYCKNPSFTYCGTPVMATKKLGELERRISTAHHVGDKYFPNYWRPMTIIGRTDVPITPIGDGDFIAVGSLAFQVLEVPGHSLDHIALYEPYAKLFIAGDQIAYNQHPAIMLEDYKDQYTMMIHTMQRLQKLDATLVLCGHGAEGSNLSARCEQSLAHFERQLAAFKQLCLNHPECTDVGELSYIASHEGKRTPWEKRSIFGRRTLLILNMGYAQHLISTGVLPDTYDITILAN